jgi:hypothetical protein
MKRKIGASLTLLHLVIITQQENMNHAELKNLLQNVNKNVLMDMKKVILKIFIMVNKLTLSLQKFKAFKHKS